MTGSTISRAQLAQDRSRCGSGGAVAPAIARAQLTEPVRIGALMSLTGAGGTWGPIMAKIQQQIVAQVNDAGGVLGQKVEYFVEDDQTNSMPASWPRASSSTSTRSAPSPASGPRPWRCRPCRSAGRTRSRCSASPPRHARRAAAPGAISCAPTRSGLAQGKAIGQFGSRAAPRTSRHAGAEPVQPGHAQGPEGRGRAGGRQVNHVIYDGTKTSFRSERSTRRLLKRPSPTSSCSAAIRRTAARS